MIETAFELIFRADPVLFQIIGLSLWVSLWACVVASCLAMPLGAVLAVFRFRGREILIWLSSSFMALPPVVLGLLVYLALSRAGPLGDFGLLFTPKAMIIAQVFLIFPIVLSLSEQAMSPLQREYKGLFLAFDASASRQILTVLWDARFALVTCFLAGLGRALSEVGAVLIVGGNINGVTRVMTTTIALETSKGNLSLAIALGFILLLIALGLNGLIHLIRYFGRKYDEVRHA